MFEMRVYPKGCTWWPCGRCLGAVTAVYLLSTFVVGVVDDGLCAIGHLKLGMLSQHEGLKIRQEGLELEGEMVWSAM